MSRLLAPSQLAVAHLVLSAAVLLWNIALAGQIARMRNVPRVMGALSAVAQDGRGWVGELGVRRAWRGRGMRIRMRRRSQPSMR